VEELYFGGIFCFKINSSMAQFEKKNKHGKHPRCVIVHTLAFLKTPCLESLLSEHFLILRKGMHQSLP